MSKVSVKLGKWKITKGWWKYAGYVRCDHVLPDDHFLKEGLSVVTLPGCWRYLQRDKRKVHNYNPSPTSSQRLSSDSG